MSAKKRKAKKDSKPAASRTEAVPGRESEPCEPAPARPGLPAPESIVEERTLVSPKGTRFRILRTNERDATDTEGDDKAG